MPTTDETPITTTTILRWGGFAMTIITAITAIAAFCRFPIPEPI